jgi:hypothetical protein
MAKKVNPMWGAAIGVGSGTATAVGIRQFVNPAAHPKMWAYSEAIGLGVSTLSGAAMLLLGKGKWKDAGWTALASGFLNNGLRQIEMMMLTPKLPSVPTMGDAVVEPTQVLQGQGLGIVDIEPATALQGLGAYHESGADLPQLVGATLQKANEHVQLVGGPALSEHGAHWGSTLFAR